MNELLTELQMDQSDKNYCGRRKWDGIGQSEAEKQPESEGG